MTEHPQDPPLPGGISPETSSEPGAAAPPGDGPDVCPHCAGTGWLVEEDEGRGTARRCSCRERDMARRLVEAAAIPRRYQRCRFRSFHPADPDPRRQAQLKRALADCRRYVDSFLEEDGTFRETGLLFTGPPGGGKTHLAVAVLRELVERYRVRGHFVELTSLVHRIQATFERGTDLTKSDVLHPVLNAEVLVMDELGAQKLTPWLQDTLYLLINTRYTRRLTTLFTTNFRLEEADESRGDRRPTQRQNLDRGADPPEERLSRDRYGLLSTRLPPMLISRLYEMAMPVRLDAVSDHRQEVQAQQTQV